MKFCSSKPCIIGGGLNEEWKFFKTESFMGSLGGSFCASMMFLSKLFLTMGIECRGKKFLFLVSGKMSPEVPHHYFGDLLGWL